MPANGSILTMAPMTDSIPGPWWFLALLLYTTFVLHILAVNAVAGVAFITLFSRLRTLISSANRKTISSMEEVALRVQASLLPKGVALLVNLAVPVLLFVQVLYGMFIYSSSILMALYWISIMLVVMAAYYGLYINTATRTLSGNARTAALFFSVLLLMANAFILVNNTVLMQSPPLWSAYAHTSGGTLLALADPQVLPRWLHALLSCVAVGGLCIAVPANRRLKHTATERIPDPLQEHAEARTRQGLLWFSAATFLQLPVGSWFLLSLPKEQQMLFMGGHLPSTILFAASLLLLIFALFSAHKRRPLHAAAATILMVAFMGGMRHFLRSSYLDPYYAPLMRDFVLGPVLFFAAALLITTIIIVMAARAYSKGNGPAEEADIMLKGENAAPIRELATCRETDAGTDTGQDPAQSGGGS